MAKKLDLDRFGVLWHISANVLVIALVEYA